MWERAVFTAAFRKFRIERFFKSHRTELLRCFCSSRHSNGGARGHFIVLAFILRSRSLTRSCSRKLEAPYGTENRSGQTRSTQAKHWKYWVVFNATVHPGDMNFYDDLTAARFSYERIFVVSPLENNLSNKIYAFSLNFWKRQ